MIHIAAATLFALGGVEAANVNALLATVQNTVPTAMTHEVCKTGTFGGLYSYVRDELVVCGTKRGLDQNGVNILKHEAIHLAQDCYHGGLGDTKTAALWPELLDKHADHYGVDHVMIDNLYGHKGAAAIDREREAYALQNLTADEVERIVVDACKR